MVLLTKSLGGQKELPGSPQEATKNFRAEILTIFSLLFWSKRWHQKDILKLTDLYQKHPKYLSTYSADMPKSAKAFWILSKKPFWSVRSPWSDPLAHEGLHQNFGGTMVLPMVTPLVCVCMTLRRACILFSRLLIMFNRTLLSNNIFL